MPSSGHWGGSLGKPHGAGELPQKLETGPGNTAQTTKVEGRPHKLCLSHKSSPQTAAVWASNHACWEIETEIIPEPQKFAMGWHFGQRARHNQKQKFPTGYYCTFWVSSTMKNGHTHKLLVDSIFRRNFLVKYLCTGRDNKTIISLAHESNISCQWKQQKW